MEFHRSNLCLLEGPESNTKTWSWQQLSGWSYRDGPDPNKLSQTTHCLQGCLNHRATLINRRAGCVKLVDDERLGSDDKVQGVVKFKRSPVLLINALETALGYVPGLNIV